MKKIYHLSTCSTNQRIIKETKIDTKSFIFQDIKKDAITPAQLEEMKTLAGSYEALFSRKAILYKTLQLKDKVLQEVDYRNYILEEYTFLKRPVVIIHHNIFIGNDKKTIELLTNELADL